MKRLALALSFAAATTWACEKDQVQQLTPILEVSPLALDFGEVVIGASITQVIEVRNKGEAPLSFETAVLSGDTDFSLQYQATAIPPSGKTEIRVTILPLSIGDKTATVRVNGKDVESQEVTLRAVAVRDA